MKSLKFLLYIVLAAAGAYAVALGYSYYQQAQEEAERDATRALYREWEIHRNSIIEDTCSGLEVVDLNEYFDPIPQLASQERMGPMGVPMEQTVRRGYQQNRYVDLLEVREVEVRDRFDPDSTNTVAVVDVLIRNPFPVDLEMNLICNFEYWWVNREHVVHTRSKHDYDGRIRERVSIPAGRLLRDEFQSDALRLNGGRGFRGLADSRCGLDYINSSASSRYLAFNEDRTLNETCMASYNMQSYPPEGWRPE